MSIISRINYMFFKFKMINNLYNEIEILRSKIDYIEEIFKSSGFHGYGSAVADIEYKISRINREIYDRIHPELNKINTKLYIDDKRKQEKINNAFMKQKNKNKKPK